jgi:CRP-like cAMP-binding protein
MGLMKSESVLELIGQIPFFEKFTPEERKYFASLDCQAFRYLPGEQIIKEGEEEYSLCILLQGAVRITKNIGEYGLGRAQREAFLTRLKPVTVFGEISLLAHKPRSSNAYADGKTVVLKMSGDLLERLEPVMQNKIHKTLVELLIHRLEDTNKQLIQLTR